jgi:hypothetical protein
MQVLAEFKERLHIIAQLEMLRPRRQHFSTWAFLKKKGGIAGEWEECWKWIKIRIVDLPPKFHKGTIVTLRGVGKAKVKEVLRVLGYRHFIALVGKKMTGLLILQSMDGMGHNARRKGSLTLSTRG